MFFLDDDDDAKPSLTVENDSNIVNSNGHADEISLLAYQMDPGWFAVEAYRHFVRPENGAGFVARLTSGEIVLRDRLAL